VRAPSARRTHEDVAESLNRLVPLALSARQTSAIPLPVGEACVRREDQQMHHLLAQGVHMHRRLAEPYEKRAEPVRHLDVERAEVPVSVRRGRVPMETAEITVGAIVGGQPGTPRSQVVPGVVVDPHEPIRGSTHHR